MSHQSSKVLGISNNVTVAVCAGGVCVCVGGGGMGRGGREASLRSSEMVTKNLVVR